MLGTQRAYNTAFRALSTGVRPQYDTDSVIRKFDLFQVHSPNTTVMSEEGEVLSVRIKWPLERGIVERKDEIIIPVNTRELVKLNNFDYTRCHSPMVYIWDHPANRGVNRGKFTLTKPDDSKFVLTRYVGKEQTLEERATELANDIMSKYETQRALEDALNDARADFGDPLLNLPCSSDEEDDSGKEEMAVVGKKRPALAIPPSLQIPKPKQPKVYEVEEFNGHSKPTTYNGVRFKSLSEAKFARILDILGIQYNYEVMTFKRPDNGGRYTPDFFLPAQQLIVEYKPARPLIEEEIKCEEMSRTGFRVVCMYGDCGKFPFAYEQDMRKKNKGKRSYDHKDGLRGVAWENGEKMAGDVVFVVGKTQRTSPSPLESIGDVNVPHLDTVCSSTDMRWKFPAIQLAVKTVGAKIV